MNDMVFSRFTDRLGEVIDVQAAIALLHWDEEVYMPVKAGEARGRQLATLSALAHRMFTSPDMGGMIEELLGQADKLDMDQRKLMEETWYDYQRAVRLPDTFVERFAEACSRSYHAWVTARAESNFSLFQPRLETMVGLLREKAEYLGYEGSPYNALLEEFERGMRMEELRDLFFSLAPRLTALAQRIAAADPPDTRWLDHSWDEPPQWDFSLKVLTDMGFDFEAGRQDRSVHPFTTNFDICDVRITTRINPRDLFSGLMGSIHEGGHALYEQGFLEKDRRTLLAQAPSLGIHESQSRLWENIIGRSLPFWKHYLPELKKQYPGQLDTITPEQVHRAINRVRPSLIRVEADECTYNLHIMLRFEIEVALIEGAIHVEDVPALWNAKMKQYLGVDVPEDRLGCLQDIHWAHGAMGYFPTYALGNLYAAQLYEKMLQDMPAFWNHIEQGDFSPARQWLRGHVHQVGRRQTASAIIEAATGAKPSTEPFLHYLCGKYGPLYGLKNINIMGSKD